MNPIERIRRPQNIQVSMAAFHRMKHEAIRELDQFRDTLADPAAHEELAETLHFREFSGDVLAELSAHRHEVVAAFESGFEHALHGTTAKRLHSSGVSLLRGEWAGLRLDAVLNGVVASMAEASEAINAIPMSDEAKMAAKILYSESSNLLTKEVQKISSKTGVRSLETGSHR